MCRTFFPFALVLFLAACSVQPLPQAAAISPTKPSPSITDTPQPTYTPEPTLTSTPIPDPFVIQEGALLAWDASLGEYQAVVLSNGELPEGVQIIENEIVAPDGAALYRFDADTGNWAFTVPADIQTQVKQYFGEPGTLVTQENGTSVLIGTDGTILAQETENGWEITENPKQVEASLGYENITDGTFVYLPGTDTPNLLVSNEQGILGYYDFSTESWKSTQGWKEAMLADGRLYPAGNFQEEVIFFLPDISEYVLMGITDGVAIEEPFEIKTASGELLATNELAYRIYYLDNQQKLQSMMAAMVVKLPDGSVFPTANLNPIKAEYGEAPTLEQMKSYFKRYFENMPGKIAAAGFWATPEDVDKLLKKIETNGAITPYEYERFQLLKKQIAGRLEDYQKLVTSGDPSLGIILLSQGGSVLYGDNPWMVELPKEINFAGQRN